MGQSVDIRNVRADDLRYLAAVADTGRVIAAARVLGVDHSTVSRRLRALEAALGARLISRGHDGWVLTGEGRIVAEQARTIQQAVEKAVQFAARVAPANITGTVRVTAADGFGTRFVTPALTRLRARHPGLTVELLTGAQHLSGRQTNFDIALLIGEPPKNRLFLENLCAYDSAFYATGSYLEEHGDPGSAEELKHHPLIYLVDSLERVRELDLSAFAPGATVGFASTNIFALLEATRQGGGIGLLPRFIAETTRELRRIAAPITPARVDVSLAIRQEARERRDVQAVRLALHQEVAGRQDELVWPV
ncbi:LysR family transcriptional regulator [Microbacterium lushaniae]|uniref:LysR family transcriptional regulator n=2 Tax=Microbacterium lushaniae TaxID=2614639 RepID=A0A5J6L8T8_9MICO|nr:LysR family transcriptional regulator [Microbacterium lushaniae]